VIGGLHLTGQLQPVYAVLKSQLTQQWSEDKQSQPMPEKAAVKQPAVSNVIVDKAQQKVPATDSTLAVAALQPVPEVMNITPALVPTTVDTPAITSEEVAALLSTIAQLRMEMQQLQASQHSLQDGLLEQQDMNKHVRLRWIADPASRLVQIQLAWEEISLLPGLSDQQRQLAVRMHALARADVQRLQQWQAALSKWADALAMPLHANVLPKPDQAWLAWIVDQFQLRQAPTQEARRLSDLRSRLLDVARQLSLESWPNQGAWQRLQAELLLQIQSMQHASNPNSADDTIDTGLPADFSAIQVDIATLRQSAIDWLHDAPQGEAL